MLHLTIPAGPSAHRPLSEFLGRCVDPCDTVARAEKFFPVMGITRIANVTGLDTIGIPVVMVSRPNSRSLSVAQGKGLTLADARASGVMEAVETYHAERVERPLLYNSYNDLKGRHSILDIVEHRHIVEGGSPWRPRLWIEGVDLIEQRTILVPYELVHLDLTEPTVGRFDLRPTSNGLASGNTIEEARLHAICEVVERDAVKLWFLRTAAKRAQTKIDCETIDDPACCDLLTRYQEAGVLVGVWECTSEIGLPTFLVRILNDSPPPMAPMRPSTGMGCHPRREVALRRALTEAAQSRLTFIAGARDDMFQDDYEQFLDPTTYRNWLGSITGVANRDFHDVQTSLVTDTSAALAWVVECVRAAGAPEIIAVDLTKAILGIPVVRVVIPKLETTSTSSRGLGSRGRQVNGER